MNSVVATTYSAVYLAMRHIFPDTPLNAGAFEPLLIKRPEGTFLDARYPRPVSGCAAEVSQRIAEAVFLALVQAIPDKVTAAPAGSSGNFALGGFDPAKGAGYVMYQISGGGYGGNADHDGLTNGCSTIGISKSQPVEVLEQYYPDPVQALRAARGLGRGGRAARRLRRALRGGAAARGGAGVVRDGPRPLRPAGRAGRRRRRAQRGARASRRRDADPGAPVEGPGHPAAAGRPRGGDDAGRRRLRRSVRARCRRWSPATSAAATTRRSRRARCSAWRWRPTATRATRARDGTTASRKARRRLGMKLPPSFPPSEGVGWESSRTAPTPSTGRAIAARVGSALAVTHDLRPLGRRRGSDGRLSPPRHAGGGARDPRRASR